MLTMFAWVAVALLHAVAPQQASANAGPRAYRHHASPSAQTNYIITSKPFTVRDDANAGAIKWRRDTITGASLIGASDPAKMKYSIECTDNNECAGIELGGSDATFKPYTQDELNRILKRYGEADSEAESSDKILSYDDGGGGSQDKSKASWNLVDQQQQQQQQQGGPKSPYDDRRGWVTLEPMAWSSSHIQKWEPNNRPTWPPPPQDHAQPGYSPWGAGGGSRPVQRPSQGYHQPQQSEWTTERPWIRPTYDYSSKPQPASHYPLQQKPSSQSFYGWNNAEQDIITDGKPGQFPTDAYHKPSWGGDYGQSSQSLHHSSSPPSYGPRPTEAEGDGQWVLLSSTKGYSIPHRPNRSLRGRSIDVNTVNSAGAPDGTSDDDDDAAAATPVRSSKRTVRLMVLPPEKDALNVTTSHGGMIQVDVSRKSVDQEQREYAARALKNNGDGDGRASKADDERRAMLAAVDAGVLPAATVAMFLPVMVDRKRRDLAAAAVAAARPPAGIVLRHHVYPR